MANETVPAAPDPSRSSTNFTFTCCAMHISVSVVPCCVTPDYADSSQHRQTRRLGSHLPNIGGRPLSCPGRQARCDGTCPRLTGMPLFTRSGGDTAPAGSCARSHPRWYAFSLGKRDG